jgi:hypothetical protein
MPLQSPSCTCYRYAIFFGDAYMCMYTSHRVPTYVSLGRTSKSFLVKVPIDREHALVALPLVKRSNRHFFSASWNRLGKKRCLGHGITASWIHRLVAGSSTSPPGIWGGSSSIGIVILICRCLSCLRKWTKRARIEHWAFGFDA